MADLTSIIAGIDGMRNYESNRALSLSNQAQNMQNEQMSAIMRLKNELAGLQNNPYAKWGIYDPQGRQQQLMNEDKQLQIASKWANSIKNLAPEKRAQGYAQFLRAMPTLGIDVSDMPQGYDEAYINQLADLGIETETRYQNEQANARQERQIAATQANLERQIAANREARQDEFEKRLAAYDYKNNALTKAQKDKIAEADEYINGLGLDEELTMRLKARNHGIELPEMPSELGLKEQAEIAKNAGLTLDPEALNEGRIVYAAKPQANLSGDAYLYQQMIKDGMNPTEALDRLGKMTQEEKLQNEIALKQAQSDIENQAAINRDKHKLQNDVVLEGVKQRGREDLANLNAQNAETAAQNEALRKRQLAEFKASLPTEEQKNIKAAAAALNLPESALYQQAMEQRQAQIQQNMVNAAKTAAEIPYVGKTNEMKNAEYLQENPDMADSPAFKKAETMVNIDNKTEAKEAQERATQKVKAENDYRVALSMRNEALPRIDSIIEDITKNPNTVGAFSSWKEELNKYTGRNSEWQKIRGNVVRKIKTVANDLIAKAKQSGTSGINTVAEINFIVGNVSPDASPETLIGALEALKEETESFTAKTWNYYQSFNNPLQEYTPYSVDGQADDKGVSEPTGYDFSNVADENLF